MATVFISYSRKDLELVEGLRKMLATGLGCTGYEIFKDDRDIHGGDDWERALYDHLDRSFAVIACLSPDYYASHWCTVERERAEAAGTRVIPVLVREVAKGHLLASLQVRSAGERPLAAFETRARRDTANKQVADQVAEDLKQVPPTLRGSRAAWAALARVLGCSQEEAAALLAREGDDVCAWLGAVAAGPDGERASLRVAFDVALGVADGWSIPHFPIAVSAELRKELAFAHGKTTPFEPHTPPYWDSVVRTLVEMASGAGKDPALAFAPLANALLRRFGAGQDLGRLARYSTDAAPGGARFAPAVVDLWVNGAKVRRMEVRAGPSASPSSLSVRGEGLEANLVSAHRRTQKMLGPARSPLEPRILRVITEAAGATRPLDGRGPHAWENQSGEGALDLFGGVVVWPIVSENLVEGAPTPQVIGANPCCVVEECGEAKPVRLARAGRPTTVFTRPSWDRPRQTSPVVTTHKDTALSILLPDPTRDEARARLFPGEEDLPLPSLFERAAAWQRNGEEVHLLWTDADLAPAPDEDFSPLEDE